MAAHRIKCLNQDRLVALLLKTNDLQEALSLAGVSLAYHERWLRNDPNYAARIEDCGVDAGLKASKKLRVEVSRQHRAMRNLAETDSRLTSEQVAAAKEKLVDAVTRLGTPYQACSKLGISYWTHRSWLRSDEVYACAIEDAIEMNTEMLEDAAIKRAVHGTSQPIYANGEIVGHRTVSHDQLMMFLLKGRRPDAYRNGSCSVVDVVVANTKSKSPNLSANDKIPRMRDAMEKLGYSPSEIEETIARARDLYGPPAAGS